MKLGTLLFVPMRLFASNFYAVILAIGCISLMLPGASEAARLAPEHNEAMANREQGAKQSDNDNITQCLLSRPYPEESALIAPAINIRYPAIGNAAIDKDISAWVTQMADAFAMLQVDILREEDDNAQKAEISGLSAGANEFPFELWGEYEISKPSDHALSLAFELWNYVGNSEGNLEILTLNYNLLTGQRLDFVDIFEKPDVALELMAAYARKALEPKLGAVKSTRMFFEGTAPLRENYDNFMLTSDGIRMNFQPWQVAPGDAGVLTVNMPLEELLPSMPLLDLWGRG